MLSFVATFEGADAPNNTIADITTALPVTSVGNVITFSLQGLIRWLRPPFSVEVTRYDTAANAIAAKTLDGHPLIGWRFWRVLQNGSGRLIFETGAVDLPAFDQRSFWGFFLVGQSPMKLWQQYLQHIFNELQLEPGGAQQGTGRDQKYADGEWNDPTFDRTYIMTHVCGHAPTSAGLCE